MRQLRSAAHRLVPALRRACLLLAAAAAGCAAAAAESVRPPIVCEWASTNFAWGAQVTLRGIAADGRVLMYDSREPIGGGSVPVDDLMLSNLPTAADLTRRYAGAWPTNITVAETDLERLAELASAVAGGDVSREPNANDMGQSSLHCFVPADVDGSYAVVTVVSHGDWEERNEHPDAPALAALIVQLLGMPNIP
ncbi:MAG: hypothetical protein R3F55_12910 [Alphaproteobacteria bacterium]